MKLTEIKQQGYKALIDALGVAGTLRFLHQLEVGYGDYTKEHHECLDQLTINDFRNYVKQKRVSKLGFE
ncbi:hypothetical protein [Nostoc sp.]|uniref:hypothetical protein n=1 Tax=Nostoc sp. TaxID=1180 RepID=UPI002FFD451C